MSSEKECEYELLECVCRLETADKVIQKYRDDYRRMTDTIMELEEQVCMLESMIPDDAEEE